MWPVQCYSLPQKEAKRFLGALAKRCQLAGGNTVTAPQLYALADDLELAVPDMEAFLGELNDAGARLHMRVLLLWGACALHLDAQM